MALIFKVISLVLTLVGAQNTTDYDYETTGLEETSPDNITELPKTTTMMAATTTLPPEENSWPKDNSADAHYCPCNLKINECDVNCCCDIDCTKDMMKAFDCLSDANFFQKQNVCHQKLGWFCIFKGLGEKVEKYSEDLRSSVSKYSWNQGLAQSEDLHFSNEYKVGEPVLFYSEIQRKYSTFNVPHEFGVLQPIRHLQPSTIKGKLVSLENITHFLKAPTENATSKIEFYSCENGCTAMHNRTLPKNPYLIEFNFVHNFTSLESLKVNFHFKNLSTPSTIYKVNFENIVKGSKFELSGPKGYLYHKPIIVQRNDNVLDYLDIPFMNEKVLFGENVFINSFFKSSGCESFRNSTIEQLLSLKASNFSELGSPKNSSNLWHAIEVDLENMGESCENFTQEIFFNFEFARSKVDNIPHQNLLKKVEVKTGIPGKVEVSRYGDEYWINVKIRVMFYDLTDISYKNGQLLSCRPLWIFVFLISCFVIF